MATEVTREETNMSSTTDILKSPSPAEGAEATTIGSTVRKPKNEASPTQEQIVRQWFNTLSSEERAVAMGFTDGPWLRLWTQLVAASVTTTTTTTTASPSLSSATTSTPNLATTPKSSSSKSKSQKEGKANSPKRTTDRSVSTTHSLVSIDWHASVCLDEIERRWKDIAAATPETYTDSKAGLNGSKKSDSQQEKKESAFDISSDALEPNKSVVNGKSESDAYRIRDSKTGQVEIEKAPLSEADTMEKAQCVEDNPLDPEGRMDATVQSADAKKTKDSSSPIAPRAEIAEASLPEIKAPHPRTDKITEIMSNVCSVVPAVFQHFIATSNTRNDTTSAGETETITANTTSFVPFITLHPTYISTITGEDLFSAMDEAGLSTFIIDEGIKDYSVMDCIRALTWTTAGSAVGTMSIDIPLYKLILLRFSKSVSDSYLSRQATAQKDHTSSMASFFRRLRQDSEPNLLSPEATKELMSKFPKSYTTKDESQVACFLRCLLLPLEMVTGRLRGADDLENHKSVLRSIHEDFTSILLQAPNGYDDDLEAIVAAVDASGNGLETSSNVQSGLLSKKSKKKRKKKKKNRGSSGTVNVAKQTLKGDQATTDLFSTHGDIEVKDEDVATESQEASVPGTSAQLDASLAPTSMTGKSNSDSLRPDSLAKKDSTGEAKSLNDSSLPIDDHKQVLDASSKQSAGDCIEKKDSALEEDLRETKDPSSTDLESCSSSEISMIGEQLPHQLTLSNEVEEKNSEPDDRKETTEVSLDDEHWETVGARPRDRRKKGISSEKTSQPHGLSVTNTSSQQQGNKKKNITRNEARRRNRNRKMVKDILNSVLDRVDEETRSSLQSKNRNETMAKQPLLDPAPTTAQNLPPKQKASSTMRDMLLGGSGRVPNDSLVSRAKMTYSDLATGIKQQNVSQRDVSPNAQDHKQSAKMNRGKLSGSPTDQNTVPTIPETLSTAPARQKALGNDSISGDSLEAQKSQNRPSGTKEPSPSPPLPTLLSPGNNNSSSSSVASSLDAPHGSLPDPTENEVGYHLLGVCKRLSDEIALFMRRRDDALSVRRQERRLVLAALEDSLSAIWPGMCSVEMYGSCATNLDLPSSDLDVVVCGLDRPISLVHSPSIATSSAASTTTGENGVNEDDVTQDEECLGRVDSQRDMTNESNEKHLFPQQQVSLHHNMHMMYPQVTPNIERVMRLAVELEQQPWAVHVKAIPTASVPVIKILADPARLSGAVGNNDWLVQHAIPSCGLPEKDSSNPNQSPITQYPTGQDPPLWRGADVVNGLLKVDITFEGPEHGGIGSTEFSTQVVEEFASETGLAPEATPAVQVLMVLKEILAQRRLNEPFSGGLSSYALLLLVISVIKERSIIREELEKAERQRRSVAAGGGNSSLRSPEKSKKTKEALPKLGNVFSTNDHKVSKKTVDGNGRPEIANPEDTHNDTKERARSKNGFVPQTGKSQGQSGQSSWASIAKQSSTSGAPPQPPTQNIATEGHDVGPTSSKSPNPRDLKKPNSFADAVAKGVSNSIISPGAPPQHTQPKSVEQTSQAYKRKNKKKEDVKEASQDDFKTETKHSKRGEGNTVNAEKEKLGQCSASLRSRAAAPANLIDRNGLDSSVFPQGFHDVVEVLCSGETTPGKLLLHFLLFYGQHFDSQSTAVDFSGTHQRDALSTPGYSTRSPYLQRHSAGNYDPITGMLTVDPIVVYDPLEGAETNNVARSCFAWSSIRWLFAQSYMTLSSTVESNATQAKGSRSSQPTSDGPAFGHDQSGNVVVDPNSPLLELLLSY